MVTIPLKGSTLHGTPGAVCGSAPHAERMSWTHTKLFDRVRPYPPSESFTRIDEARRSTERGSGIDA